MAPQKGAGTKEHQQVMNFLLRPRNLERRVAIDTLRLDDLAERLSVTPVFRHDYIPGNSKYRGPNSHAMDYYLEQTLRHKRLKEQAKQARQEVTAKLTALVELGKLTPEQVEALIACDVNNTQIHKVAVKLNYSDYHIFVLRRQAKEVLMQYRSLLFAKPEEVQEEVLPEGDQDKEAG